MHRYIGDIDGVPCYVVNQEQRQRFDKRGKVRKRYFIFRTPQDYWDASLRKKLQKRWKKKYNTPKLKPTKPKPKKITNALQRLLGVQRYKRLKRLLG